MRLTRAALRAESIEAISIETADASNLSSDLKQRIPLGEVSANSLPDLELEDAQTKKMPPKKLRKGAAKKGAKGNKVEDVEDEGADPQVLEDERQAAGSPASDAAVDELSNGPTDGAFFTSATIVAQLIATRTDIVQVPMNDTRPTSPPSRAVRMTRRQLAKFEEEELAKAQSRAALLSPPVDQNTDDAPAVEHEKESLAEPEQEVAETLQLEPSVPEADQAVKTQEPEVAVPTVEEAVEIQEPEVVVPTVEEAAEIQEPEIVALEEEHAEQVHGLGIETAAPIVETVIGTQESELDIPNIVDLPASATAPEANEVEPAQAPEIVEPEVLATSDVEPKTLTNGKSSEENSTPATSRNPSRASSRTPSRSPMRLEESIEAIDALEEALDKVGQAIYLSDHSADEKSPRKARFSDVVGIAPNKRTRPSSVVTPKVSRAPGVIRSLKPPSMPVRTSPARSSSMQVSSKESRKGSGEVSDYLASKRRPISMSFPAPPPPPKSTKPPTRSTFQLPGEAVAAKLKAQKEERLRREAEGEVVERRAVTLPPRPKSTKLPTTSTFQLPGEAVAARLKAQKEERLRREAEGEVVETVFTMPPRPKSTKPPTVATFQLPGEIVAAKLKAQKEERLRREAEGEVVKKPRPMSMPPPPKSTKPPTVANFQLPGEAISAKLRAQKEERLKREEEEATKRSTFKARPAPIRKNIPATVRQTSASIARENLMAKEHQPTSLASKRSSMMGPTPTADKRNSALVTRPAFNLSTTQSSNRNSLLLSQGLSSLTPADAAAQRIKAREQFHKEKVENESKRKDRLSKEDAAKKARDEAAEQGRIRSRLWAEKQKQRALSASVMRVDEGA
jgi:hypothetical protein